MQQKKLFCFGFGYVCDHLEQLMQKECTDTKWDIWGTTGDEDKEDRFKDRDISLVVQGQDTIISDIRSLLEDTTHLLISVPPKKLGCPIFRSYIREIVNVDTLEWIGYLSSTSVYGDRNGAWVTEDSESRPTTIRGSRRNKAEEQWRSLLRRYGAPIHTFRLSGIYGEGRSAIDSINAGIARRIYKEGHVFNRIHIEDIAQIVLASMKAPCPGQIYNLSDDEPAPSHEVISEAANLMGVEEPELVDIEYANLAPMTQSFYSDNKRVGNSKTKEKLNITLKYPTFREGLRQCYEVMKSKESTE